MNYSKQLFKEIDNYTKNVNNELKEYISKNIFPQYEPNDKAHGIIHIMEVIRRTFELNNTFKLDLDSNIMYVIAACHDLGKYEDHKIHEKIAAQKFIKDENMKKFFNDNQRLIIKEAIENAKVNALNNQVKNCRFICGDSANECEKIVSKKEIDCLIVDPPRSGLDDKMIYMIRSAKIKQIFYISCNPSTLAKNLSQLKNEYEVERIIPYDMFTHTPHIETIVILSCKK